MNSEEAKAAVETADWKLGADDGDREMAMHGTLLLCIVGSTVHGLAVRDGVEDLDVMGICCEPPERVIGLMRFEQWVGRTKAMGERSEAGDVDAVVYSLRKWSRLALQGNPTVSSRSSFHRTMSWSKRRWAPSCARWPMPSHPGRPATASSAMRRPNGSVSKARVGS